MRENFIGLVKQAARWGDDLNKIMSGASQQTSRQLWGNFGRSLRNLGRDTAALGGHYGGRALNYTRDTVLPAAGRLGRQAADGISRFARNKAIPYWNSLNPNMRRTIAFGGGLATGGALAYLANKLRNATYGDSGSNTEDPIESKYSPLTRPIIRYIKEYEKNTAPIAPINVNPNGGDTGIEYRNRNENPFGEPSFKIRNPYEFPQN